MAEEENGELSIGYLKRVNIQEKGLENAAIILQVSEIIAMPNGKFAMLIHDCKNKMKAILNSSLQTLVQNQQIENGTVIQVTKHNVNSIRGENVMIIHEMEVLQKECPNLATEPVTMVPKPMPLQSIGGSGRSGFGSKTFGNQSFGNNTFGSNVFGKSQFGKKPFGSSSSRVGGGSRFYPLKGINPFMKEFTVKARVTSKSSVRHWRNARGEGKLFSVNLIDAEGTEIQGTAFNDAVDTLYPIFEEGKVFIIRKARAKLSRRQYTHITHQYSLDFADAEVTLCDDDGGIEKFKFNFKSIEEVASMDNGSFVDIIGICQKVSEIANFTSKKGNELTKRSFCIVDESASNIECALWGDSAHRFESSNEGKVICLQAAKVSDYGGRTLSVNSFYIEPEIPEVQVVKMWWQKNQNTLSITSLTQSRTMGGSGPPITLNEANLLGQNAETPDYFNAIITFTQLFVKPDRNPWYNACPSEPDTATQKKCMKKVIEGSEGEGTWYCAGCAKNFNNYVPRYILKAKVADHTGSLFVGLFDDMCKTILSKSAADAEQLKETDMVAYNNLFTEPVCKRYRARMRAKQESYNDEIRTRFDIVGLEELNCKEDMSNMYTEIQKLLLK